MTKVAKVSLRKLQKRFVTENFYVNLSHKNKLNVMETRDIKLQRKDYTFAIIVANLFLIIGTCTILAALIYMIINLNKADSIVKVVMPFMVAGIFLVFGSLVISLKSKSKLTKKPFRRLSVNRAIQP